MPKRDSTPIGAPCWVDLLSSSPEKSKEFYSQLFGWTAEESGEEYGNYINFSKNGNPVAGAMKNDGRSGMPDVWGTYLASADVNATARSASANGGKVLVAPMRVGDMGSMAVIADSSGATVGVWQSGTHKGYRLAGEAGAPVWHELHTRDYRAAVPFYQEVFGWKTEVMSDTDEFRYTTLGSGDDAKAGIMDASGFLPEGVPSHWVVYFGVANADQALKQIEELGGKVLEPAQDTPYGRMAAVTDSTGASFRISQE